jgi:hypothetical protein
VGDHAWAKSSTLSVAYLRRDRDVDKFQYTSGCHRCGKATACYVFELEAEDLDGTVVLENRGHACGHGCQQPSAVPYA